MASIHDLMHHSGFVFEGTVEQLGASTSKAYAPVAETVVVRVTRLVKSTPALAGYQGQRVTVHLQAPVRLAAGQHATFFTHGIHYGNGLVLTEVGTMGPGAPPAEAEMTAALQASNDTAMAERLAQADLVVSGVASAPHRRTATQVATTAGVPTSRVSEHDPDWWVATIAIDSVVKGTHDANTKDVLFANSTDIAWARSPKVRQGDRGVWLLHTTDAYGRPVPAHAVTHPLDFRPVSEVARVRRLMR